MPADLDVPAELAPVRAAVARALEAVAERCGRQLASDLAPVNQLCEHVEAYRGKMLRPSLVMLAYLAARPGAGPEPLPDAVFRLGAVCELVHMATLVHDDVLDEADIRRKGLTVNRLHGNEAAVVLGDYLFSAAYHLCAALPGPAGRRAARLVARTGMSLCAGELLQLHHRHDLRLDEAMYLRVVSRKTASLIAAACRLGALGAAPAPRPEARAAAARLARFGRRLGVAFQIQDDLLDLTGAESAVGKPVNRDLALGKLTLPVIHHLRAATPARRAASVALIRQVMSAPRPAEPPAEGPAGARAAEDPRVAGELRAALEATGSIAYARGRAAQLVDMARAELEPLPPSPAKSFLGVIAAAVINRSS
ncbi:MAG TPA: polyprenyl synthetase family protein [Phycisphaerales bacterium]|nr:polyprenyl synthetase family protein [Phycisphaerales bacterium]